MDILLKMLEMIFSTSREKRENGIYYLKSLVFLVLLLILFSDMFWGMKSTIRELLDLQTTQVILKVNQIAAHLFTSLVIISFVVIILSAIVCVVLQEVSVDIKSYDYVNRLRLGAQIRFSDSIEYVLITLLIGYILNDTFVKEYTDVYSDYLWICIFIACGIEFFCSTVKGVINRFFVLWDTVDREKD